MVGMSENIPTLSFIMSDTSILFEVFIFDIDCDLDFFFFFVQDIYIFFY